MWNKALKVVADVTNLNLLRFFEPLRSIIVCVRVLILVVRVLLFLYFLDFCSFPAHQVSFEPG